MSLELLYTSATAGLRQGSRGFCTVLSTTGMPANLAQRLEMLSGYRHVFSPQDDQAAKNPISYSHVRIRMGGKSSSVLSRVASYGTDYSGRTNKLAHHVAIDPHEQSPAGPAWLLAHGNIMRSEWAGQTQTPPSGPPIPQQQQSPRVCQTWDVMTGDAGWGGYVADAMSGAATKPLWIIFDLSQSQSLLTLLDESIALLPESSRWSATFSTYYTNLPPEIDCRVRCVLAGTEEARLATARGTVIDLTANRPLAAHTELVELARTGHRSPRTPPLEVTAHAATATTLAIADEPPDFNSELDDLRLLPASVRADVSGATRTHGPPPPRPVCAKKKLPLILATVAIVLFVLASGASVYAIKRYANLLLPLDVDQAKTSSVGGNTDKERILNVGDSTKPYGDAEPSAGESKKDDVPIKAVSGTAMLDDTDAQPAGEIAASVAPAMADQAEVTGGDETTKEASESDSKNPDAVDEDQHVQSSAVQEGAAGNAGNLTAPVDHANERNIHEDVIQLRYLLTGVKNSHVSGEKKVKIDASEIHAATSVKFDKKATFKLINIGEKIFPQEFPSSFMFVKLESVDSMTAITIGYDASLAYTKKEPRTKFDETCLKLLELIKKLPERKSFVSDWKQVSLTSLSESKIDTVRKEKIIECNRIQNELSTLVDKLTLQNITNQSSEQLSGFLSTLDTLAENVEIMPVAEPTISHRREDVRLLKDLCDDIVGVLKELTSPQKLGLIAIYFRGSSGKPGKIGDGADREDKVVSINPEFALVLETETK